ncbi:MAG: cell division topological specificity factor MinE [Bdellovibrionales bacterium]|nr:cell division topological specificity factor MinE [Bdellovibrionales bacterium]
MFGLARIFGKDGSKKQAKNRLQMVLVQDRSGLTPQDMDLFKKDLIGVISKYFETERSHIDVEWQRENGSTALIVNMPVVGRIRPAVAAAAGGN